MPNAITTFSADKVMDSRVHRGLSAVQQLEMLRLLVDLGLDQSILAFDMKNMDHHQVTFLSGMLVGFSSRARAILGITEAELKSAQR